MVTAKSELKPDVLGAKQGLAFEAYGGLMVSTMIHLGVKLGLYSALHQGGALTSTQVADRAGMRERFVREWLYQQAASGILEFRGDGMFEMTPEATTIFVDRESPTSLVAMFDELPELVNLLLRAEEGFRSGRGNSYDDYGPRIANLMEATFGAWNRNALVSEALPKIPGLIEKLTAGARVADVGCGGGSAPLAVAKAYPRSSIDGYENSLHALAVCTDALAASGLENVRFLNNDVTPLPTTPTYDLVMTLDCLHDMPRPDLVSAQIWQAMKPDGVWFIADMDGAATPDENVQHPMGSLLFGSSVTLCLQSGGSTPDGLALETLGLPESEMRKLVTAAGFTRFNRVQGLQHPLNAYYEVRP